MNIRGMIAQKLLYYISDSIPGGLEFNNTEIVFHKNNKKHYISNSEFIKDNTLPNIMIQKLRKIYEGL